MSKEEIKAETKKEVKIEGTLLGEFYSNIKAKWNVDAMEELFKNSEIKKYEIVGKISSTTVDKYRMDGNKLATNMFKIIKPRIKGKLYMFNALKDWFIELFTFPMASINVLLFNLSDEYWEPIKKNPEKNKKGLKDHMDQFFGETFESKFKPSAECYPFYEEFEANAFDKLVEEACKKIRQSVYDLVDKIIDEKVKEA